MMMRKLVVFLATALLLMPLGAQALGFGRIVVHSALDEPLDADIELISPTPEDITNLKVKLASPEAYLRAGIDRSYLLGDLRFRLRQDEQGKYYIHVSSKQRIKEPFLNFLLEMNWQNGRMVREYTVLLDPPDRIQRQPAMVEPPATHAPVPAPIPAPAAVVDAAPIPAPQAEAPAPVASEEPFPRTELKEVAVPAEPAPAAAPATPAPAPEAEAPAPAPAPVPEPAAETLAEALVPAPEAETPATPAGEALPAPAEPALAADEEELFPRIPLAEFAEAARTAPASVTGELDYGIVQKGDTLWKIAEKLRPGEAVSIYQVMMALLVSNPEAFVDGNMNRLKVGHVLRIDDPDIITSVNPREAEREYRAQLQAWQDYRQSVAGGMPAETQPVVAGEAAAGEMEGEGGSGELTLASPDGGDLQAGTGTGDEAIRNELLTLREELRQLREDSAAMGGHNEQLNRELRALEEELDRRQRALSISDDELAALQQQLASAREAAAAQPAPPEAEEPAGETAAGSQAPAPAETHEADEGHEAGMHDQAMAETETPATAPAAPAGGEEEVAMAETKSPVELAEEIAQREQQRPQAAPAPAAPVAQDEGGIMQTVMGVVAGIGDGLRGAFGGLPGNSLLMFVGLPVLLVLLLIAAIVIRRRRSAEDYQESILTGEPAAAAAGTGAGEAAAAGPESEEASSFLSDFAVSGAGAIQTEDSEVDPLTEADVFVAYGRYEAAEERLKEAIENDPNRAELKLKLIELYHTTRNKPAFENAAEEFYASLGDGAAESPMWQKVVAMGVELVPNNPLFSNAGSAAAAAAAAEVAASDTSSASLTDSQVMDIGLDTGVFDVADLGTSEAKTGAKSDAGAEASVNPMDSGVMEFTLDTEPAPEAPAAEGPVRETQATASDENNLDFNLDLETPAEASAHGELAADSDLDFNLDTAPAASGESSEKAGEESLDFNLEVDEAPTAQMTAEAAAEAGLDFTLDTDTGKEDSGTLDFDLDLGAQAPAGDEDETAEMSLDLEAPAAEAASASDTSMAIDISDDSTATMPEPSGMDFELDATDASLDIGTGDEVGTKLDLAKAYIDMGDPEGARSILDEVLDEGNEEQKQEAQQLLQQIA